MGLFSFIKDAGAKLFGKEDDKQMATKSAEEINFEKAQKLMKEVMGMGLPVEDLNIVIYEAKALVFGKPADQATKEKIILTVGNTEGIAEVDDRMEVANPEPEATFYTVKKGDYLSKIAKEVYGDASKYNIIFEANKPMLKDPDLIYPGQVLRIPPLK
ncbi:MAG TPA: peptidoglycan-binding protein LysM [Flavobacteriia bacterium]|jgi:nucleoid-associated protein YgaU|nr:peptidoglycan-binding protein LysM [Flavobacteriia bacterium]